jgi:zinc/manganese transport system substrate-binding protein
MRTLLILLLLCVPTLSFAKLKVVTTIQLLGQIANEIAKDQIELTILANPNQDPHFVDPKPNLLIPLSQADLLLINGAELEDAWLSALLNNARNPKLQVGSPHFFNSSQFVQLLEIPNQVDRSQGDVHGSGNPHFLYDLRAVAKVTVALANQLALLDPSNASVYMENGQKKSAEYLAFAQKQRDRFAGIPKEKRVLISYHRSLSYFLDWLQISSPIQLEPKPGIPPSPQHMAQVLSMMKSMKIRVLMQEKYYASQSAEKLAQMVQGKLFWFETGVRDGQSLVEFFEMQINPLFEAFSMP